jgi:phosphatidylglycerophosphatase A
MDETARTVPPAAAATAAAGAVADAPLVRPDWRFLRRHPAHWVALGFGSGLAPRAPGTVGTLWAWAAFVVLDLWLDDAAWGWAIAAAFVVGWWACTLTARHMRVADPGQIVWDEVLGFWIVLWLWMPAGLVAQALAFALFRFFDAVKRGPVGWTDRAFKRRAGEPPEPIGWRQGFGILADDLVAALLTLLVLAAGTALTNWGAR